MALSAQENELYDRQIRLWGSETQAKLRTARVLLLNCDQASADLAKNLVLSGARLTLRDSGLTTEEDVASLFLCRSSDIGLPREEVTRREIAAMNELTEVRICSGSLESEVLAACCVVLSNAPTAEAIAVNSLCRSRGRPFYYLLSQGNRGGFFCDFGDCYEYTEKGKHGMRQRAAYCPLEAALQRPDWPFAHHVKGSFEPCVSAVLAGEVSQDIVKVVSGVGEPVQNCFVYDMFEGSGCIRTLLQK